MARKRWHGWRVEESGRTIRSNPKGDGKQPKKKKRSRRDKGEFNPELWWWLKSRFNGKCDCCHESFSEGDAICFRRKPKTTYCEDCAQREGMGAEARLSKSMQRTRPKKRYSS